MNPLSKREISRMGLIGPDDEISKGLSYITIFPSFMAVVYPGDEKAQQVDVAQEGDIVVITSNITLTPKQTLVAGDYCPKLYDLGLVSGPRFFFPDYSGRLQVTLQVTKEFHISQIPYLMNLTSMGDCK